MGKKTKPAPAWATMSALSHVLLMLGLAGHGGTAKGALAPTTAPSSATTSPATALPTAAIPPATTAAPLVPASRRPRSPQPSRPSSAKRRLYRQLWCAGLSGRRGVSFQASRAERVRSALLRRNCYLARSPASTARVLPVMNTDRSLAQNSTTRATSSGTPTRPSGLAAPARWMKSR